MHLETQHLEKIDKSLRKALSKASEKDPLRVILVLKPGADQSSGKAAETKVPAPSDFSSRQAYRKALIKQRRTQLEQDLGETRRSLEKQSLRLRGGKLGHIVVADGQAQQIVRSLEMPGVESAQLDREIQIPPPRKRRKKR